MSQHEDMPWNDERLRRGVQADTGPGAREDFRARLKADFVAGKLGADEALASTPAPRPRWTLRWAAVLVPIAAAIVLYLGLGPSLEVVAIDGEGLLQIDDRQVALQANADLADDLASGAVVEVPEGASLSLRFADILLFEATPGTRLSIPATPHRFWHRDIAFEVTSGEVLIKTGADFPGRELRVETPEGLIVVTGTLLSIERSAGGTCVCVVEGTAKVGRNEADLKAVPAGQRRVLKVDGSAEESPVVPPHRDALLEFHERLRWAISPAERR